MNFNFKPFPTLLTARLVLRQLSVADAAAIHELRSDAEVNKMLGREASKNHNDALLFIEKIALTIKSGEGIYWVIELEGTKEFAGTICLYNFDKEKQEVEIGYELLHVHHGKGLATEAVKEVIRYAFETMGALMLTATPADVNKPSIRLLEKLNFKLHGSFTVGPEDDVLLDYQLNNSPKI